MTDRDPLGKEKFIEAVLEFLGNTSVGKIKERVALSKGALKQPANCSQNLAFG